MDTDAPARACLLRIRGVVQGVGFRASMTATAHGLGVAGWVRNRRDGSVEALVQGTPEAMDQMLAWARQGPPWAQVEALEITQTTPQPVTTFAQRPST